MVTRDEALHLLGVSSSDAQSDQIKAAFDRQIAELSERLASAPTDGLRAKYQVSLSELTQAYALLKAEQSPSRKSGGGLSHTQFRDLPGATPQYTEVGERRVGTLGLKTGDMLTERYEIRRLLGQGGMGAVYEAFDRLKRESIAVKVLLPELLSNDNANERLLNEAKIAVKLSHPNIVKVFDVGVSGPYHFITMELLEGQTLRQRIEAQKLSRLPFPVAMAVDYAKQLIGALDYANKAIVHRDLKPENIWVMEDGSLKLMDFGIARAFTTTAMTKLGMSLGTAYYMAPEQLTGAKEIDWRADQFSLGVVLYELLTGQIPQGAVQTPKQLRKDLPAPLSSAVMRAMATQANGRFGSWKAFASGLTRKAVVPTVSSPVLIIGGAVVSGAALVAILLTTGVVSSAWEAIRPVSREEVRAQQAEALRLQSEVKQSLGALGDKAKDLQQQLRDARSAVDRFTSHLATARDADQRNLFQQQLNKAQAELDLVTAIQANGQKWVFSSTEVTTAATQSDVAEAFIHQQDHSAALNALSPIATSLKSKLAILPDIESYRKSVQTLELARTAWESYASNLTAS